MKFKVRSVKPSISRWFEIEAENYIDAAQEVHQAYVPNIASNNSVQNTHINSVVYNKDGGERVYFSLIEVEGYGEFVSRIYYKGIRRKGKMSVKENTLENIAKVL